MSLRALLLLGPTGSGKTPLGAVIGRRGFNGTRCLHFDFGHEMREITASSLPPQGFSGEDQAFLRSVLEDGVLLEDDHFPLAQRILRGFLRRTGFQSGDLLVLNGLPRHAGQARDMQDLVNVETVLVLECTPETILERIIGDTGGDRAGRPDDTLAMIGRKLEIFSERTFPLRDFYAAAGSRIITLQVTAAASPEDLYDSLGVIVG